MHPRVRRAGSTLAIVACLLTPGSALAQGVGQTPDPDLPTLEQDFPDGAPSQSTPTPEPTATREPRPTPAPTPTPDATRTPRPDRGERGNRGGGDLARTGTDPLPLALGGLTLIGFGIALRLRIALDDARRRYWIS